MNVLVVYHMAMLQLVLPFKYLPEDAFGYTAINSNVRKHIAKAENVPHQVLIVYGNFYCSGALVRSRIVATTASCFERRVHQSIVVKVGADVMTSPGQIIPVQELKIHEYYKHSSAINNDIALLVLKENVKFGKNVKKIVLVEPEVALRTGATMEVFGWGHTNLPHKYKNTIVWSEMVVMDQDECKKYYNGLITSSSFCAKYQPERRLSDNGGPASYSEQLVGLLSFGGTGDEPHVAVLTNVSYFHRWITLNSMYFMEKYCKDKIIYMYIEDDISNDAQ